LACEYVDVDIAAAIIGFADMLPQPVSADNPSTEAAAKAV
jgi:hypothetical protein